MIPAVTGVGGGSYQDYIVASDGYAVPGPDTRTRLGAWPFSDSTGFGTAFTEVTLGLGTNGGPVGFGPNSGSAGINLGGTTMYTYPFSGAGFGTVYAQPTTAPTQGTGGYEYRHFPTPGLMGIGGNTSPYMNIYAWTNASGYGTRYSNPATLPSSSVNSLSFGSSTMFACWGNTSPYVRAWAWSSGFGTAYANPATLPTGSSYDIAINRAGTVVMVSMSTSPYIHAYAWSAGWGTKFANPATLPTGLVGNVSWRNTDDVIALQINASPYISAYPWSSGFGTKYADPSVLPAGNAEVSFNYDGTAVLAQEGNTAPNAYRWASGWGTKYTAAVGNVMSNATFNNP